MNYYIYTYIEGREKKKGFYKTLGDIYQATLHLTNELGKELEQVEPVTKKEFYKQLWDTGRLL